MKKLYTLAAVAALAFSANAQLYIVGNGEGLAWDPAAPMTVQLENNAYTVTINNLVQFKMSTASGTWDDFNGAALSCIPTEETLGTPMPLTKVEGDMYTPWKGTYTIAVSADFTTMTLTTTTPKPSGTKEIYLRGGMNNWLDDQTNIDAGWKFTQDANDPQTYILNCAAPYNIPTGTSFKIADLDWSNINYGAGGAVYPDEFGAEWQYNASDAIMAEDFAGVITIKLPEPARAAAYVTLNPVNSGVETIAVDNTAEKEYFNLQGIRVANPESGLYIVRQGNKVYKEFVK